MKKKLLLLALAAILYSLFGHQGAWAQSSVVISPNQIPNALTWYPNPVQANTFITPAVNPASDKDAVGLLAIAGSPINFENFSIGILGIPTNSSNGIGVLGYYKNNLVNNPFSFVSGVRGYVELNKGTAQGLVGIAQGLTTESYSRGALVEATSLGEATGLFSAATGKGSLPAFGIQTTVGGSGSGAKYGIYATVQEGSGGPWYAGYFKGNVVIQSINSQDIGDRLTVNGNVRLQNGAQGVIMTGQFGPMITSGNNIFTSGAYAYAGQYGLFLENQNTIRIGIPSSVKTSSFRVNTYDANSNVSADLFRVNWDGSAWLYGTLTQSSDVCYKKNIIPLENSLTQLTQLNGYHYYWKDETRSKSLQTGVIAQEAEKIFPELVEKDEKGFLSVNYIGLIPHLIEAVKELKKENEVLSRQNQDFKATLKSLQSLRAEVAELKNSLVNASSSSAKK